MKSIFKGKERKDNELILDLLLRKTPLNKKQIAREIGGPYGTIYARVDALKDQGLVEPKEPARNGQPIALWGLSSLGLWVQAQRQRPLA
jgi:predicted transcriptional regulator